MIRVECKNKKGGYNLLFKVYSTGLELRCKGELHFLEVESSTLKKLIDNLSQSSKIRIA